MGFNMFLLLFDQESLLYINNELNDNIYFLKRYPCMACNTFNISTEITP